MHPNSALSRFLKQVKIGKTFQFAHVAESVGLSWVKEIKPAIKNDPEFREAFQEVLEEIKLELLDGCLQVGLNGKDPDRPNPEISYINAIIKIIDSGTLTGEVKEEKDESLQDEALLAKLDKAGYGETKE